MRDSDIPFDLLDLAEPPLPRAQLQAQIADHPASAAAAVALLRSIDLDDRIKGIEQESRAYAVLQGGREHAAWLMHRDRAPVPEPSGQVCVSRDGDVIDILLDRPDARNAVDRVMRDALHDAFTVAALDPEVTKVRLRGVGKAFCVGADLSEFGTTRDPETAHAIRMQTLPALAIIPCAHKFEAHVQGACIGSGLEMVAFAQRLTAAPNAWFQLPELAMGLIPGAGGSVSVGRRIGRRRATLLILSGKRINAITALGWGLIDAIVDQ
jgi:enoyl-CoA hydratase